MHVLITNDDGIHAPGLWALHRAFAADHAVTVVAPDRERSAVGHGITLNQPLRFESARVNGAAAGYAVSGTPADCVKLGLAELLEQPPDLVISGINPGANVGINVNYSGTVAAAKEAALAGIPALAVSIIAPGTAHLADAARFAERFARRLMARPLPAGTFLNVNVPDLPLTAVRGVRWSRQGSGPFAQRFERRKDPRNRTYFWQGCDSLGADTAPDVDSAALAGQYIAVTPIKCDMTDYDVLRELGRWEISIAGDDD